MLKYKNLRYGNRFIDPLPQKKTRPSQESVSSHSRMLQSVRLPLFVVEIAYVEGVEGMAASSKTAWVDPSELMQFLPTENEFHTRLEVRSIPVYAEGRPHSRPAERNLRVGTTIEQQVL